MITSKIPQLNLLELNFAPFQFFFADILDMYGQSPLVFPLVLDACGPVVVKLRSEQKESLVVVLLESHKSQVQHAKVQ